MRNYPRSARRIYLFLLALCSLLTVNAQTQKKPGWVTSEPKQNDIFFGISKVNKEEIKRELDNPKPADAGPMVLFGSNPLLLEEASSKAPMTEEEKAALVNSNAKSKATEVALLKVAQKLPWGLDQASLLVKLAGSGIYKESYDSLLLSHFVKMQGLKLETWEDEKESWAFYSISTSDFAKGLETMVSSTLSVALSHWKEADGEEKNGNLFRAAVGYANALNAVIPIMFRKIPIENGPEDLCKAIYDGYLNVYSDLELKPSISDIPAIAGEKVPHGFQVVAVRNGLPVKNCAIELEFDGRISFGSSTDEKGVSAVTIDEVTSVEKSQKIRFAVSKSMLSGVPETFASEYFKKRPLPETEVTVNLFDPQVYLMMNFNVEDSLLTDYFTRALLNRGDIVFTKNSDLADLILTVDVTSNKENEFQAGDYKLCQYVSFLNVALKRKGASDFLFQESVPDFKTMIPSTKPDVQAKATVIKEMLRFKKSDLDAQITKFYFDKRSIVWEDLANHLNK